MASAGLPILFIKAPGLKTSGTKPRVGEFDYLKYVLGLAGRKSQVVVQFIAGTDHSFANRVGRAAVRERMESWLSGSFPALRLSSASPQYRHSELKCRSRRLCGTRAMPDAQADLSESRF